MKCTFSPYEGNEAYCFVSYSHQDADRVAPILDFLHAKGLRIWYDEGIEWGSEWPESIARHLMGARLCLLFHSHFSVQSDNCRQEIYYAKRNKKQILSIFLEEVRFNPGVEMQLSAVQATYAWQYDSLQDFLDRLARVELLQSCCGTPFPVGTKAQEPEPEPVPEPVRTRRKHRSLWERTSHPDRWEPEAMILPREEYEAIYGNEAGNLQPTCNQESAAAPDDPVDEKAREPDARAQAIAAMAQVSMLLPDHAYGNDAYLPLACMLAAPRPLPRTELLRLLDNNRDRLVQFEKQFAPVLAREPDDYGLTCLRFLSREIEKRLRGNLKSGFCIDPQDGRDCMTRTFLSVCRISPERVTICQARTLWQLLGPAGCETLEEEVRAVLADTLLEGADLLPDPRQAATLYSAVLRLAPRYQEKVQRHRQIWRDDGKKDYGPVAAELVGRCLKLYTEEKNAATRDRLLYMGVLCTSKQIDERYQENGQENSQENSERNLALLKSAAAALDPLFRPAGEVELADCTVQQLDVLIDLYSLTGDVCLQLLPYTPGDKENRDRRDRMTECIRRLLEAQNLRHDKGGESLQQQMQLVGRLQYWSRDCQENRVGTLADWIALAMMTEERYAEVVEDKAHAGVWVELDTLAGMRLYLAGLLEQDDPQKWEKKITILQYQCASTWANAPGRQELNRALDLTRKLLQRNSRSLIAYLLAVTALGNLVAHTSDDLPEAEREADKRKRIEAEILLAKYAEKAGGLYKPRPETPNDARMREKIALIRLDAAITAEALQPNGSTRLELLKAIDAALPYLPQDPAESTTAGRIISRFQGKAPSRRLQMIKRAREILNEQSQFRETPYLCELRNRLPDC